MSHSDGVTLAPVDSPLPRRASPPWWVRISLALVAMTALAAIAAVGWLAARQGLQDRVDRQQRLADDYYQAGIVQQAAGNRELAAADFEQALRLDPGLAAARSHLATLSQTATVMPTPTSQALMSALDLLFLQGDKQQSDGDLEAAAATFEHLADIGPDYRWQEVEDRLFGIYSRQAADLFSQNRLEEAIHAYDRALRIRPTDQALARQRELLALYQSGVGAFGADWAKAVADLTRVYQLAPAFLDTPQRLYGARIGGGDAFMGRGDWCSAQALYEDARELDSTEVVLAKIDDATSRCRTALTAPTATPPAARAPGAGTPTPGGTPATPVRLPFGRLAYAQYDPARGTYDVVLLTADGAHHTVVQKAGEPDLCPDGKRIAFRSLDLADPGIQVVNLDGSGRVRVTRSPSHMQPRWSPDGKRILFISGEDRPTAAVLIAPADGSSAPKQIATGWSASWSARGAIALTGCGTDGEACGIEIAPNESASSVRLTADRNDIGEFWSPDGSALAYMSNHDGNWEVYTLRPEGSVVRRCTVNPADDVMPTWAPNGSAILFESNRDGTWALYVMEPDGSKQRKVLDLGPEHPSYLREQLSWGQ